MDEWDSSETGRHSPNQTPNPSSAPFPYNFHPKNSGCNFRFESLHSTRHIHWTGFSTRSVSVRPPFLCIVSAKHNTVSAEASNAWSQYKFGMLGSLYLLDNCSGEATGVFGLNRQCESVGRRR
jgi:hypothetical protein